MHWLKRLRDHYQTHEPHRNTVWTATLVVWVIVFYILLEQLIGDRAGFRLNIITEGFGIFVTVFIVERFNQRRQRAEALERQEQQRAEALEREEQRQRKEDLRRVVREMRSSDPEEARRAAEEARDRGFFNDGLLREAYLRGANLSGFDLQTADLEGADLTGADLRNVDLQGVDLRSANLNGAKLQGANLRRVNLRGAQWEGADLKDANLEEAIVAGANLAGADLESATLTRANLVDARLEHVNLANANLLDASLSGASLYCANLQSATLLQANLENAQLDRVNLCKGDLSSANLKGANLQSAKLEDVKWTNAEFDEKTLLPDAGQIMLHDEGSLIRSQYWTPDVDMARYCNPKADHYWQPGWAATKYESYNDWKAAGSPSYSGALIEFEGDASQDAETDFRKTRLRTSGTIAPRTRDPNRLVYPPGTVPTPPGEALPELDINRYTDRDHSDFWQPDWAAAGFDSYLAWSEAGEPSPSTEGRTNDA